MGKKKKSKKPQQKKAKSREPKTQISLSSAITPAREPRKIQESEVLSISPQDNTSVPADAEIPANSEASKSKIEIQASNVKSRFRRMLPDIMRVVIAFSVIMIGVAIWIKPPLLSASFPRTTYIYKDGAAQAAKLYRPIAMQERYYVELPEKLANRYQWFAIDRRREEVALCEEPQRRFFGKRAIKRGDPLGLDLEFRDLDGSEWLIHFYTDAIVFSNNLLTVRLDTKRPDKE